MAIITEGTALVEELETSDEDDTAAVKMMPTPQTTNDTKDKEKKPKKRQTRKTARGKRATPSNSDDASEKSASLIAEGRILEHNLQMSRIQSNAKHTNGRPISFGYIIHPKHPVPWAKGWPEAAQFYTFHVPDYTGLGLYDMRLRYPDSHRRNFRDSFRSFTMQIMMAEGARLEARLQMLMDLKGWLLRTVNEALKDPKEFDSHSILNIVNGLALYDLIFENGGSSTAHLHGLQVLLKRYGGMAKMAQADFHMSSLVYITDAMHSHLNQSPRLIPRRVPGTDIMDGVHHLRLALQPTQSKLSSLRLRSHMTASYGSPAGVIFLVLSQLYPLVESTLNLPPGSVVGLTPGSAFTAVQQLEALIDTLSSRSNELSHPMFSDVDRRNHRDTYELIRLSALVLIQQFKVTLSGAKDKTMQAHLDHVVQALLCHLLNEKVYIRSTEAFCWALMVGAPFLDASSVLRKNTMSLVSKTAGRLHLDKWADMRVFLEGNFFSPPLQEKACIAYWEELELETNEK